MSLKKNTNRICRSAVAFLMIVIIAPSSLAQAGTRSYDQKLDRLSESLGAIHYLRELCSSNDGQKWRNNMQELINAVGTSSERKAVLARQFNRGYRGYSHIYPNCTHQAKATIKSFIKESIKATDELIKYSK
ncbi:MAG: TIGR02301 family protein [Hyphomicrobiaceae bacterium]|nr:TIGR02301 family protein [Hyphomicrobiaceae bacterium]